MENKILSLTINTDNPDRITVSARDLHKFLEVETQFKDWFPRMCAYGFAEGTDFNSLKNEQVQKKMITSLVDNEMIYNYEQTQLQAYKDNNIGKVVS